MQIVTELKELRRIRNSLTSPFGLVPTMGFLHAGHVALVERAKLECASVGVSIFVNPLQFGPREDLAKYPRNLERDLEILRNAGADVVWTPTAEEMYPPGYQTFVNVEEISKPLEGLQRPGHFRGVATVVTKLFNAFTPDKAYFGQKDAQQTVVIKRMALDLNIPIEVVVCPTLREPDGLAMSSRNVYLAPDERQAATVLYRALNNAKKAYDQGERDARRLRTIMSETISTEPLAASQYVSVADPDSLVELEKIGKGALISMAVFIGKTRLIDNFLLP